MHSLILIDTSVYILINILDLAERWSEESLYPIQQLRWEIGQNWLKKQNHCDAVMTGILVTRFKMGQINVEDLAEMAADESRAERCSAAKKVLEAVRDSA
jgi:hypothetical protein